ncbi:MAG: RelA/SpoT family protein [Syntrophobacterales bacterium]|nr:RelA/SpoT family protein [Syntrophobacterales bacterium]
MPKDFYKDIILQESFDKKLVERAYKFAKKAHHGQKRRSGEAYITHPLAVAKTLLSLGMSDEMAAAALLHDVIEDTDTKYEDIEAEFGVEVAGLVKSLTALRQVDFSTYSNPEEAEEAKTHAKNENLRQLFLSMSDDVRVVIIKLADRLHNMETIKSLPIEHQQRVSRETLNIFAPLALRLGMGEIKGRLEDLAFPIAYPQEYKYLKKEANRRYKAADRYTLKVKRIIDDELKRLSVSADVEGRAKHIYSLYKKITRPEIDWDFDKVYDLVALRVVTDTEENCYKILGAIHGKFRPIPNYVRDYIAAPKPNGYRSIHTTVFGPEGKVCEIQIRTKEMHEEAEYGVASHLHYTLEKSSGKSDSELEKGTFAKSHQTDFLKRIKEWQVSVGDDTDFLEGLKMEFLDDRIYVFSPNGDIFDLPVGATPVDFAYEVHSRIGDRCRLRRRAVGRNC